ncbi:hypothetical protein NMY22_g8661 [Coprinellus aureogranulatus]|nr:hypothetical protein NMY22_g8661 [Coprinellus aureogranulatus]
MPPTDTDHIAKEDLLTVLDSMKIVLPRTSKLSTEALSKRLKDGFNASQRTGDLIKGDHLDPRQLKPWADLEGLMRQTMVMQQSLMGNFDRQMNQGIPKGPEQTFEELQDILLFLGCQYNLGVRNFYLSDRDFNDWAIAIRIFGVYAADDNTPVFVLSYRVVTAIPNKDIKQQMAEIFPPPEQARGQGIADLARRAFLRLLTLNSKGLIAQYEPEDSNDKKYSRKKKWKMSFVLPLGPVPMEDVGKLTTDPGCDVCGNAKNTRRCTQCLTAVYCSPECQSKDWPAHKDICRGLQGGTWTEINLGEDPSTMAGMPRGMFMARMNVHENIRFSEPSRAGGENGNEPDVPPNIHGNKAFLIKFQVPGMGGGRPDHVMMYDRKRSFTIFWKRSSDPEAFAVGERAMDGYPKMYRWAMRTGPRTMKICFDRPPRDTPPW